MLGIKPEKLEIIQKILNSILTCTSKNKPNFKFFILKQNKESLQNFKSNSKEISNLDFLIIIHKVEGRLFLLGRNGFYNKVCDQMLNKTNIFFILLYKSIYVEHIEDDLNSYDQCLPSQFQKESINNLINKGDQKDLKIYTDQNKIICLDEEKLENDIKRRKKYFEYLFFKKFIILNTNDNKEFPAVASNEEADLFEELNKKINSKIDANSMFKCFIL